MIIETFMVLGAVFLALTIAFQSHRRIQAVTVAHATAYLAVAMYAVATSALPIIGVWGGYFFLDHLGAYEIIVAAAVFLLAGLFAGGYVEGLVSDGELRREYLKGFYITYNILMYVTVLSFTADNLALFWILAELTTFFSAVLIAVLSTKKNIEASLRYIFVTSASMLFTFIGLIFLYVLAKHTLGVGTLEWTVLVANSDKFPPGLLAATSFMIFIGYASKAGIAPFHTWLPHAHAKAPSAISAILSGVLLNIGIYGILRLNAISHGPHMGWLLMIFGVLSVAVASLTMLKQSNLKKLIAFSSIEHMGLSLAAIGAGTAATSYWMLYHILLHSLTKTLLFLCAGILHRQYHTNKSERMGDALRLQPIASTGLILGAAAISGLPPFPIFTSKLMMIAGVAGFSLTSAGALLLMLVIASSALTIHLMKLFSNTGHTQQKRYTPGRDMIYPIIAIVILLLMLSIHMPQSLDTLLNEILSDLRLIR